MFVLSIWAFSCITLLIFLGIFLIIMWLKFSNDRLLDRCKYLEDKLKPSEIQLSSLKSTLVLLEDKNTILNKTKVTLQKRIAELEFAFTELKKEMESAHEQYKYEAIERDECESMCRD